MAGRSFSDDEVARILARAAELQHDREQRTTGLEDIERAASEAGIDPALVRAAASEVARGAVVKAPVPEKRGFFGPSRVAYEIVIDGEVDSSEYARLNDVVAQALNAPAVAQQLGTSLQWAHQNVQTGRGVHIAMTTRDGRTTIRLSESLATLMGGVYGGVGAGFGVGGVIPGLAFAGAITLGPLGGVLGGLLGTAVSVFGTRALYLAVARARERSLQRVFDALVSEVRTVARARSADASAESNSEQGGLDAARDRQGLAPAPDPLEVREEAHVEEAASRRRRR